MKKKVFYWSPCLNPVGTVISTLNSAIALSKYSKDYKAYIINVCGEWDSYIEEINKNSVEVIEFKFKYFKYLPKTGYIGSRFSYFIIFVCSFFPLLFLLKSHKPQILILHLISSLPLTLLNYFSFETKFILRISGYPKLNFIRKFFWKKISKKIDLVTCPTLGLKNELNKKYIFKENKIFYLPDAILNYDNIQKKPIKLPFFEKHIDKKIILSVGRLTKQKNFSYLINEFNEFNKVNNNYILYIIGEGEEKENLLSIINKLKLSNKVFLGGYRSDVYDCMKKSDVFILSSLWEEVGFVIVEAAFNNLFVISSNCPNGPEEFLNKGQSGILFENNLKNEICKSLIKYSQLNERKKNEHKVNLKKNSLNYSKFRHYLKFNNLLNKVLY